MANLKQQRFIPKYHFISKHFNFVYTHIHQQKETFYVLIEANFVRGL